MRRDVGVLQEEVRQIKDRAAGQIVEVPAIVQKELNIVEPMIAPPTHARVRKEVRPIASLARTVQIANAWFDTAGHAPFGVHK